MFGQTPHETGRRSTLRNINQQIGPAGKRRQVHSCRLPQKGRGLRSVNVCGVPCNGLRGTSWAGVADGQHPVPLLPAGNVQDRLSGHRPALQRSSLAIRGAAIRPTLYGNLSIVSAVRAPAAVRRPAAVRHLLRVGLQRR